MPLFRPYARTLAIDYSMPDRHKRVHCSQLVNIKALVNHFPFEDTMF